jgi:hypothetical protein
MTSPGFVPSTTGAQRDPRIDYWRGLCLFGMASWHLLTHPSFPRWLSFAVIQPFNFVAEGFVLLAGAAVGMKIVRRRAAVSAQFRRAGQMLTVHYALVAFVVLLAVVERKVGMTPQLSVLPHDVWSVVNLTYQPYLADILSVFVFLFAAVPAFRLVYERFGPIALAALSAVIFSTASLFPLNVGGAFDFNSWQAVFVLGILFGTAAESGIASMQRTSNIALMAWVSLFVAVAVVRAVVAGPDGTVLPGWRAYLAFSRKPLSIARLSYIVLEMWVIAVVTVKWWDAISKWPVAQRVASLGRYSLEVFVCSVVLDYVLKAACTELGLSFPANLLLWGTELLALFALAGWLASRGVERRPLPVAVSRLAAR